MRRWVVGLFCAVLGGFATWKGIEGEVWWFAVGGLALLVASVAHLARPSRRTLGAIELSWGALVLAKAWSDGRGFDFSNAGEGGKSGSLIVAGVLVVAGVFHLVQGDKPKAEPPA